MLDAVTGVSGSGPAYAFYFLEALEDSARELGFADADARKLAPGVVDVRSGIATGVDGVRQFVAIDDKLGVVRAIYLNLPPRAEDLIAEAWGRGAPATEPVGKNVLVWPDPTTSWRATLRPALGASHDLAFDNYLPAAQLFGEQPDFSLDELIHQGPLALGGEHGRWRREQRRARRSHG